MFRVGVLAVAVFASGCALAREGLGGDPVSLSDDADLIAADTRRDTQVDTFVVDTAVADTSADTFVEDTAPPDVPVSCTETGSVRWSGHCYFPITTAREFNAQRDACAAAGAHLASITSAAEQAVVATCGSGDRWIGLVKDASLPSDKTSFRWLSGEVATEYDNWAAGDPNGGHNCARMKADGMWADQACSNAYAALCERE